MPRYSKSKSRYGKKRSFGKKRHGYKKKRMMKTKNTLGHVPKRHTKTAMKYQDARGNIDLQEKEGYFRKLKGAPNLNQVGVNANQGEGGTHKVSTMQEYRLTDTTATNKILHVTHAWDSDDIFRTLPRSQTILDGMSGTDRGGVVGNFVWHGTNRLNNPDKINAGSAAHRYNIAKYLQTHAPYSHVRLRKVRVWLYCPEPGVGYILTEFGSTNFIKWNTDDNDELPEFKTTDADYPSTFQVEQGHKWGWLGMEFAPPISMGMTDWHPLYQYASPKLNLATKPQLQQPKVKSNISDLSHLFVIAFGTINPNRDGNNPGNAGWPGQPQNSTPLSEDAKGNLIYKFYWETKNDHTDAAWSSIRFAGNITENGGLTSTELITKEARLNHGNKKAIGRIHDHEELALLTAMEPAQRICYMASRSTAEAEKNAAAKAITLQNHLATQRPTKVRVPEVDEEPRHFGWGYSKKGVLHDAYGLPVQQEEPNREDRSRSIEERIMMKLECIENDLTLQGQAHSALCDDMEALHERFLEKEDEMLGNDEDDSFICDDEELSMSSENECSDDEDDFNPPKLFKKDTLLLDDEEDTMDEAPLLIDQVIELEENPLYGKDVPEYRGNPFGCDT